MTDTNVTEAIGPDEIAEHEDAASASISDTNAPETDDIDSGDEEASQAAAKPKR
ncbi:MAG: hypothetical protein L7W95_06000 [Alphaproteobacteria bacterium]|nr:hypothetical protein [Alphaproteobacteria bacterium]